MVSRAEPRQREFRTFVARGITTRPVRVAGDAHSTAFSREALEGMARQVRENGPLMPVEHLSYLGPVGRWVDAEVVDLEDGHSELLMYGKEVSYFSPTGADPQLLKELEALPEEKQLPQVDIDCSVEFRIFEDSDATMMVDSAPLPLRQEHKWADLPPLEWILTIPVVWGASKFAGAFFSELGRASGAAVAKWFRQWSARAKSKQRDWIVTLRFQIPDGTLVYGFIPVRFQDSAIEERIASGLDSAGIVATLAGARAEGRLLGDTKEVALILDERGNWELAWWTDGERVFRTRWFSENCPDPERFLGRPLHPPERIQD